jgi:alkyl hydroperoxide reductase subunit AhpC
MIGIGKPAPSFRLPGTLDEMIKEFSLSDFRNRWLILFFYPADFTFICPTVVLGFQKKLFDFEQSNAAIVGISVDPVARHADLESSVTPCPLSVYFWRFSKIAVQWIQSKESMRLSCDSDSHNS